jgi:NADPH-dependent 2,4-dienoyl-CoA reductase/sulfur reductase-like enzyme/nitrite reductase/ring-hydroxylating ferredoxin subunit
MTDQVAMHEVAAFADVADQGMLKVELEGKPILLLRDGVVVRAYGAACPHAGAPLDEGAVCNGRLVCPWHKAVFRIADGALLEPPALDPLTRFAVQVVEGRILVAAGPLPPEQPEASPKMADERMFIVVGAGAAGVAGAAALREFGFGGRVLLVGQEAGAPYDRTSLSKFVMSGDMAPGEVPPLRPPAFYAAHRIEREHAEVVRLDAGRREVALRDGRVLPYDAALLAPGAVPVRVELPGISLAGVHVLRSQADAAEIMPFVEAGARAVILGSGFIGLEVASAFRGAGLAVTVVAPEAVPFARQFGPELGGMFRTLHEANGVVFRLGAKAARLEGEAQVRAVVLESGERIACELVIMGAGVRPATGFVTGVTLNEDGGVPVDTGMRAAPGLFAAGDAACFPWDGAAIRVEHWRVAQQHARVAVRNMLGGDVAYVEAPYFWTYHYGNRFDYIGHPNEWDETVVVGDPQRQDFVALMVRAGRVVAALGCGRERVTAVLADRIGEGLSREQGDMIVNG